MRRIGQLLFSAILTAALVAGCSAPYETLTSETVSNADGESLTLTASPDNLNIGACGEATIQILLRSYEGESIEGGTVYLTASNGNLANNTLISDQNGTAITILSAGNVEGWAVINATYGTIIASVSVSLYYDGTNDSCTGDSGSGFDDDTGSTTDDDSTQDESEMN